MAGLVSYCFPWAGCQDGGAGRTELFRRAVQWNALEPREWRIASSRAGLIIRRVNRCLLACSQKQFSQAQMADAALAGVDIQCDQWPQSCAAALVSGVQCESFNLQHTTVDGSELSLNGASDDRSQEIYCVLLIVETILFCSSILIIDCDPCPCSMPVSNHLGRYACDFQHK